MAEQPYYRKLVRSSGLLIACVCRRESRVNRCLMDAQRKIEQLAFRCEKFPFQVWMRDTIREARNAV